MTTAIAYVLSLTILLVSGFLYLNRPIVVTVASELPAGFPVTGFSHDQFETLLKKYVDQQGNVDYEQWHGTADDRARLESYLAAVAAFSPESTPERFPKRSDALAYWLYGYNAWVIRSALEHWPLDSVTDVKAPIEAVTGLGFFYRRKFIFGGNALSLYGVENDIVRKSFRDPRIHFVLNCASASCPVLRPELPVGEELEDLLASSAVDFVNDPRNVRIDHDSRQVILSTIFKWYRSDFLNDLRRRGLSTEDGALGYIADVASVSLRQELDQADGYALVFADYDWAINKQEY